jgi:hypothetical protein
MAASTKKFLDENGLLYYDGKIKGRLNTKVDKVTGKGLSTNDLTNELKQTYDETVTKVDQIIAEGGEPNVIDTVKVNGTALTPDAEKAVNIDLSGYAKTTDLPTKVSDLTNDGDGTTGSKFATEAYVNTNGGKIDKIKVNGTEQTITNKAVDITVPTKTSDLTNDSNFAVDASYVHTDNNYTTAEKNKLSGVASGAQVNKIESIKVNGTAQTITSKAVDITVPTNNNQLTNGAGYQTASEVQTAINSAISGITGIDFQVVTSLPATGTKGVIYLISNSGTGTNIYDEYIWVTNRFEKIGTTEIDLSNYYNTTNLLALTNQEIDTIISTSTAS